MSIFVVLHGQYFSVISAEGGVVITSWKRLGALRQVPLKVKELPCSVQIVKSRQLSISVERDRLNRSLLSRSSPRSGPTC